MFPGIGSIVNALAIAAGGVCGSLFGKKLTGQIQNGLTKANGVCVLFIGMSGALSKMMATDRSILIILSFFIGTFLGEWINISAWLDKLAVKIRDAAKAQSDQNFIDGFVTATLTVCIGAMAIVGSIQEGINGDPSILFTKSLLDFIIILSLSSSLGKGTAFSAIPVFVLQFGVTLLAGFIAPWMSDAMLENISLVGSILIFCVGLNLVWGQKVNTANMLPSLIVAAVFALF